MPPPSAWWSEVLTVLFSLSAGRGGDGVSLRNTAVGIRPSSCHDEILFLLSEETGMELICNNRLNYFNCRGLVKSAWFTALTRRPLLDCMAFGKNPFVLQFSYLQNGINDVVRNKLVKLHLNLLMNCSLFPFCIQEMLQNNFWEESESFCNWLSSVDF